MLANIIFSLIFHIRDIKWIVEMSINESEARTDADGTNYR